MIYPKNIHFKAYGEIRHLHDKEYLGKFIITKSGLQNVFRDIIERDNECYNSMNSNRRNILGKTDKESIASLLGRGRRRKRGAGNKKIT